MAYGQKLLTIVVPSYNMQDYITQNIQSVLAAKRADDVEVLVIDDGSTDGTAAVARRLADEHPGIVRVISKPNGHYGSAVNCGIDNAAGLYLKIVDADDSVIADGLDALLDAIEEFPGTDLFITDYVLAYDDVEKPCSNIRNTPHLETFDVPAIPRNEPFRFDDYILDSFIMHSLCFRTELLRDPRLGSPQGLRLHERMLYTDEEFATKPFLLVDRIVYAPVNVYRYVVDRPGQSIDATRIDATMDDNYTVIKGLYDWYRELGDAWKLDASDGRLIYLETKIGSMLLVHAQRRMKSPLHQENRPVVVAFARAMDELPFSLCVPSREIRALKLANYRGYAALANLYRFQHRNERF